MSQTLPAPPFLATAFGASTRWSQSAGLPTVQHPKQDCPQGMGPSHSTRSASPPQSQPEAVSYVQMI